MQFYLIIFAMTLLATLALVASKHWHGRFILDNAFGVQNHHTESTSPIGDLDIALGLVALLAVWAVACVNDTAMLALACGGILYYAAAYARPTQFRWCFSPTTLNPVIAVSL